MLFKSTLFTLAAAGSALAQGQGRPANESICDYYTTALLKDNNATNQYTLLTLLVNTAVIGNYTQPNVGVSVPGILNPNGTYNGKDVNLVPYFDGSLASTNAGGKMGKAVNFLDGGGAAPLMKNMPAEDDSSKQYKLLTHLYEFFGSLLGCSTVGMPGFSAYEGKPSMYEVHKFMVLDPNEVGYFVQQVGLSAASFGVAKSDIDAVAESLNKLFGMRCAPKMTAIPEQGPQFQSVCTDESCPLADNATCAAQPPMQKPVMQVSSSAMPSASASSSSSMQGGSGSSATGSPTMSPGPEFTGAAAGLSVSGLAGLAGVAALFV
ncbi:hypothetical protein BDV18DRAFT_155959 [Aspergillus unguis]